MRIVFYDSALLLPASCLNFNSDENDESRLQEFPKCIDLADGTKGLPSIGLYSEWQWYSMMWFCYPVFFPKYYEVHKTVSPCLKECDHGSWNYRFTMKGGNDNCIYLPGKIRRNSYRTYRLGRWGRIKRGTGWPGGPDITDFGVPGLRGYTRVYGDDPVILDKCREQYIGERCMPMLISPLYFGELGTITVGVARKNENAWTRFIPPSANVKVGRGIFEAFEPFVKWSWAFSSAKAGYKDPNWKKDDESAKADNNDPNMTSNYEYNAYVVDWRGFSKYDNNWNLCQPDWDAVFVPVSKAKSWAIDHVWLDSDGLNFNSADFAEHAYPSSREYFMNKNFMNNWMLASNEWKPLREGGEKLPDKVWKDIDAPPGMKSVDNKKELDWASIPFIMKH